MKQPIASTSLCDAAKETLLSRLPSEMEEMQDFFQLNQQTNDEYPFKCPNVRSRFSPIVNIKPLWLWKLITQLGS